MSYRTEPLVNLTHKQKCEGIAGTIQIHAGLVCEFKCRFGVLRWWVGGWLYLDTGQDHLDWSRSSGWWWCVICWRGLVGWWLVLRWWLIGVGRSGLIVWWWGWLVISLGQISRFGSFSFLKVNTSKDVINKPAGCWSILMRLALGTISWVILKFVCQWGIKKDEWHTHAIWSQKKKNKKSV